MKKLLRYPRLDSLLMLERTVRSYDGECRKKELWQSLPKKMMYQTFCLALDYLIVSRKVSIDAEGKVGWIFYPANVRGKLMQKHLFLVK